MPYGAKWWVASFLEGVFLTLAVLAAVLGVSWLIGRMRGRASLARSWRHALAAAFVFTLILYVGAWFANSEPG